ncbi:SusC/RagA family TonB-linked outer membrane protein [Cesiribacter andamanensis]|uniref:Outer membrane receptor for ferrienterochelin and colicin n=1 Tax=Cesiribacter andamanensis AMV16 TaxID=1279009 RepID=M7P1E7_9BACT|nr:SusC/RagA family TonB-linked outer membrane protein [Cesiribacter andamanensis]EMR04439.1 Outer membrane receptor for ferrienterochelin and colicin [Cesiribacter andamanensis AMV16]
MKRILLLSFVLISLLSAEAWAQRAVTGKVTDAANGDALPGVAVRIVASGQGTVTDMDGNYRIEVPSDQSVLQFSFVGYKNREVTVGTQSVINVRLQEDVEQLEAVVVTALGFEEKEDRLGSSSSKVDGTSIVKSGETGLINSMAGKASGVQITRSTGDPGAGSYIQIRGQSTITSSVQPLIVVDGVPVSNSTLGSGVDGVAQQSRLNDINPSDIASVQVLKGASAAALWGSRAANGVIMITTKKGRAGDKVNIDFRSTYSVDQINQRHQLQSTFGQGARGAYSPTAANSYGDKISLRSGGADEVNTTGAFFEAADGTRYYPILTKNSRETYTDSNFDNVFQNGHFWDNNLSISGGDEKNTFYFSLGHLDQEGIIRNNSDYARTSLRVNAGRTFNSVLRGGINTAYSRVASNRIQQGSNTAGLYLGLLRTAPDFDTRDYIGNYYSSPEAAPVLGRQRSYRNYLGAGANPVYNNPLWTINEQENPTIVNRMITSAELVFSPLDWFELTTRGGIDTYTDRRSSYFPVFSGSFPTGRANEQTIEEYQLNLDVIGRFTHDFSESLSTSLITGFNFNNRQYDNYSITTQSFIIPGAPINSDNATPANRTPFDYTQTIRTTAGYASLNVGFQDQLFVNLTGRAESSSTFGENSDRTFFYPSADVAWQFTELAPLKGSEFLTFGKLRAAYGEVGTQPAPYATSTDYVSAIFGESWGPGLDVGQYGGGYIEDFAGGNDAVEPERKKEYEIGTDLRFFDNKLRASVTHYRNETIGALFFVPVAASTGFTSRYDNAASLENRGFEVDLGYSLLNTSDWGVDFDLNWTRNRNEVTDLRGTESLFLAGFTGASSRAVVGHPVGALWGVGWDRNEQGQLVLDENGFPQAAQNESVLGDPNPEWRAGLNTAIRYKGFSISALIERSQGGDIWAGTFGILNNFGVSQVSANESVATGDLVQYNGTVIPAGTTFRGNIQDFGAGPVALTESWYTTLGGGFGPVAEQFIIDATWTRLREISLSYTLNSEGFRNFSKLSAVELSLSGRNLALWYANKDILGTDPETNLTGPSNGRGLEYFNNPNTRSFLFTVRLTY